MFDEYAIYYKAMYHTMLLAANSAVDKPVAGRERMEVVNDLIKAMNKAEDIYINSPLSDSEEDALPRMKTPYIDQMIADDGYDTLFLEDDE